MSRGVIFGRNKSSLGQHKGRSTNTKQFHSKSFWVYPETLVLKGQQTNQGHQNKHSQGTTGQLADNTLRWPDNTLRRPAQGFNLLSVGGSIFVFG